MNSVQTFQQLRGPCVHLGQSAANLLQRPTATARREVTESLNQLLRKLQEVASRPDSLDPKLAEYVFVPMSHVLRASSIVSTRALELCLECLLILFKTGWRTDISPELAGQFLILLTYLANPSSAENGIPATSEELQVVAFKCMAALSTTLASTPKGRQSLTSTPNIPALGRAVLLILDSIVDVRSDQVKLNAVAALLAIISAIDDRDALASFLPRMVSSLTKVLTPGVNKVKFRVLEQCLEALSLLFLRILSDQQTKDLPVEETGAHIQNISRVQRTTSWMHATASQIKIALANVLKLRHHEKQEVRSALYRLCVRIVQDCRNSLSESAGMVTETLVVLIGAEQESPVSQSLQALASSDPSLAELLRESLRSWIISLPRIMQSKDHISRQQTIHQISVTFRILSQVQVDLSIVNRLLAENLRDSVSNVWRESKDSGPLIESAPVDSTIDSHAVLGPARSMSFEQLALPLKGQDELLNEFTLLLQQLSSSDSSMVVLRDLVNLIRSGRNVSQLATFWLSVNLLRDQFENEAGIKDFLDLGETQKNDSTQLLDELYSFSLDILAEIGPDSEMDWRFQALAVEVVALQAKEHKVEFRVELIDALYPVVYLLGSSSTTLRSHAITCLNVIADACGYTEATDLVVSNVDYLVNAVALKLNTFDISPQAPQVLLMMIRLCGPSLLPYLDDLVESMFSALENFHGYPKLVELLFSVLKGMAEEGIKSPQLSITSGQEDTTRNQSNAGTQIDDVIKTIATLKADRIKKDKASYEDVKGDFLNRPWEAGVEGIEADNPVAQDDEEKEEQPEPPVPEPPAPKTFSILLKISLLTQHYLTSSSPTLRTSLLSLLNTTIPALAKHENSFLPFINTLWPVLLPRLDDPEAYVVSNTLEIIGLMCTYAGDFMKSRIEQIWEDLKAVYGRTQGIKRIPAKGNKVNVGRRKSRTETGLITASSDISSSLREYYVDSPTRLIWDSLVKLLSNVSEHVTVREDLFNDIVDMLEPVLEREAVASALNGRNSDAVWLRRLKMSKGVVDGEKGVRVMTIEPPQLPGKPHWASYNCMYDKF
ncbi:hypothetical protein GQ43DRAFT_416461 [Delitschia confertaspora ATCC 74209]|uniref:HEAT repeat protein n=1 Tax=Delitschia confertaspora ATCC 74209 TaxID=1513339 RepID=A0A9P4JR97_9PLEO|nr:hypothetical protein GQ43DRAFT_416461 [Delitschia confertaspora ATCC 74209]